MDKLMGNLPVESYPGRLAHKLAILEQSSKERWHPQAQRSSSPFFSTTAKAQKQALEMAELHP
jgi:hypothetical protein